MVKVLKCSFSAYSGKCPKKTATGFGCLVSKNVTILHPLFCHITQLVTSILLCLAGILLFSMYPMLNCFSLQSHASFLVSFFDFPFLVFHCFGWPAWFQHSKIQSSLLQENPFGFGLVDLIDSTKRPKWTFAVNQLTV